MITRCKRDLRRTICFNGTTSCEIPVLIPSNLEFQFYKKNMRSLMLKLQLKLQILCSKQLSHYGYEL